MILLFRLLLPAVCVSSAAGSPYALPEPSQDRWMYPSNATPGTRAQASTFSALPDSSGVDDRWAFYLFAFDTASIAPPGLEPRRYQIRSMRVTARIGQDRLFAYDPTEDPWNSYATADVPAEIPDANTGRPLELFGAGFRNGFTAADFTEFSPYGSNTPGQRNAYPLGYDHNATPRDVSNNVTEQFEPLPWSIGQMDLAPGTLVPEGTVVTFDLDLTQPGVAHYLQQGLANGRLWFSLTSLHPALFLDGEFVSYHTRDGVEHIIFGDAAPAWSADIEIDHPLAITPHSDEPSMVLSWPQAAGFSYTLFTSPDLSVSSWQPLHSETAASAGITSFTDPIVPGPQRFYRLSISPTAP